MSFIVHMVPMPQWFIVLSWLAIGLGLSGASKWGCDWPVNLTVADALPQPKAVQRPISM